MGADELIDEVTATGEFIRTAPRSHVHNAGGWHQVFHCLVVRSTLPPKVILQRRSGQARAFPNLLDLSATGHLLTGESPTDGIRELEEELGISVSVEQLEPVGVRLLADDAGEGSNRERVHLYFLADDRPLQDFMPCQTEVQALVEIEVTALLQLLQHSADQVSATSWHPGSSPSKIHVSVSDVVAPNDHYWTALAIMADRFARGIFPLAI